MHFCGPPSSSRVEERRGTRLVAVVRFRSPLIKPDMRISASGLPTDFISKHTAEGQGGHGEAGQHPTRQRPSDRRIDGCLALAPIEAVGLADLEVAWEIGNAWRDQDFSIVDRTSFAVMHRLGIDDAASLDDHFSVFRFGPGRRQSFNVVR